MNQTIEHPLPLIHEPNAAPQPCLAAGATQERPLEAVGWAPWLGGASGTRPFTSAKLYVCATTTWYSIGTTSPSSSTYARSAVVTSWSSAVRAGSSIAAMSLAIGVAERYLCTYVATEGYRNGLIVIRMWT